MNNYYTLLNLDLGCTEDEIRKAIHRELRTWTNRTNAPDLQRKQEAERRIKLLDEAETILLDPAKRANYDRELGRQTKVESAPELGETDNPAEEARRLLEDGRVADALYLAQKASEADPRDPDIWWILGRANHEFGETDRAVKCLKRAIAIRPDQPKYQFDLGNIYESTQDWQSAAQCYERAYQVDQNVLMYLAAYGATLVKMGQYAGGIEVLEECVRQEPENSAYQWFLAIAYADSAQVGWTRVGEGHSLLEPGEYATEIEQVTVAQQALAKALALKFDDAELTAQLTSVKQDIDSMTKRRYVGNWFVPAIYGLIGLMGLGTYFWLFIPMALLYVIGSYVPQYIINRQLVRGKDFNDFGFTRRVSESIEGNDNSFATSMIALGINVALIAVALPIIAVYNLYRYQRDTIRGWFTSAENKKKISSMMNRLQGAASGTVTAATDVLNNLKFPEKVGHGEEDSQTAAESHKTEDAGPTFSPASQRVSELDRGSAAPSVLEQVDGRKPTPVGESMPGAAPHQASEHKDTAREPTALAGSKLLDIVLARKKLIALGIGLALVIATIFFGNLHFRDENRSITAGSGSRSLSSESGVSAEAKSSMQSRGGQTAAAPSTSTTARKEPERAQQLRSETPAPVISQAIDAPRVRVGDRWVTEVIDHQDSRLNYRSERIVEEVRDDRIITSVRTLKSDYRRTIEYDSHWALIPSRLPTGATTKFEPALPYFNFPITPGKTWQARVVETGSTGTHKVHDIRGSIGTWETISVPAGTFSALRIVFSDEISENGVLVLKGQDVSWYVPEVRRSVKTEESSFNASSAENRRRTISLLEYSVLAPPSMSASTDAAGKSQKPVLAEVPSLSQPLSRTAPENNSVTKSDLGAQDDRCTEHFECGGGLKCEAGVCMARSKVTEAAAKADAQSKSQSQLSTDAEGEAWKAAVKANKVKGYEAFLKEYPSGRYASAARVRLAGLQTEPTPRPSLAVVPAPVPPVSAAGPARTVGGDSEKSANAARYVDKNGCLREANGSFVIGFRSDCK